MWRQEHLIIFQSKLRVCLNRNMMNAEYDFAEENEATNEKQADEQSTGDHEDSDGEGIQGPLPQPSSKDCWRCGSNWKQ